MKRVTRIENSVTKKVQPKCIIFIKNKYYCNIFVRKDVIFCNYTSFTVITIVSPTCNKDTVTVRIGVKG